MSESKTSLKGRCIVVTGAASGIGRSGSVIAAQHGARVLVTDVNEDGGNETVEIIRKEGGEAAFEKVDIAQEDDVKRMVRRAVEIYGRLDGAFNNAALPQLTSMTHDLPLAVWQRNLSVTLTGTFLCMKYEIEEMLKNGAGAIVNTSSGAGLRGFAQGSEYSSAKFGVVGLTRTSAIEYGPRGIRINTVSPGAVRTPMLIAAMENDPDLEPYINKTNPMGRMAHPDEIGEAAVWLLTDAASFVTGAVLAVDGGHLA